jgi:hypothetical protein
MRTKKNLGQFYSMKSTSYKNKLSLIQYSEENVLSLIQKRRATKKKLTTKWF